MSRVAVITRTKNRPIMLFRAFESVRSQSYRDLRWVVVNDGGDVDEVSLIIQKAKESGIDVTLVNNETSLGMEAASNVGIKASESEFVVIHDDDDSWHPEFLQKTVGFLDCEGNSSLFGVVTQSVQVFEKIVDDSCIKKISERAYNKKLKYISLMDIASMLSNPPPISILMRRSVFEVVGFFDELLPVLGDWDFLLRIISHGDLGVIPEPLANYHIRPSVRKGSYGNSIIADIELHEYWRSYVMNKYLLADVRGSKLGLGYYLYSSRNFDLLVHHLYALKIVSNIFRFLIFKIKEIFKYRI